MEIKEVIPPEREEWITQRALYAYDGSIRVGSIFAQKEVNNGEINAIYGYEIDGSIEEMPDDYDSWEEAEKVFLEYMYDHFEDEEHYFNSLKKMGKELIHQRKIFELSKNIQHR